MRPFLSPKEGIDRLGLSGQKCVRLGAMKQIMTKKRHKSAVLGALLLAAGVLPGASWAQDSVIEQGRYQERMLQLAEVLGQLQHLRGSCLEAERQTWRNNMMEMIRLEDPSADRKNELVARFNIGFSQARENYPECSRASAYEAERLAKMGAELTDSIAVTVKY